ncbi:GH116 family glycosyl hydrolase [Fulvivirgaceae bacterium BMA10]|uniref:GH116 family glycosyl hydrolase n=1 Tax=Splendidivirga corallicola TaxID=3051826 RepID=A0ABT8KWE7_9BACT|nr:GH116 family glycosyl hydrolase [Fulvivirgaceae bacterium BMA10]
MKKNIEDISSNHKGFSNDPGRRGFIKKTVLGGLSALTLPQLPVFAGPFTYDNNGHLVPEDKKLSAAWIKSLYERGLPDVFTAEKGQLKHIGMPVGGIACGQLYLGGDGRLWFWHIFKTEYGREKDHNQRMAAMTLGSHYRYPEKVFERETRPVEHGAAIRLRYQGKTVTKKLDSTGFKNISFRGEYPIGKVSYRDANLPVEIKLEAFSPFIPTSAEKSSLPVTIMTYKVKNTSSSDMEVDLVGWLENAVCPNINNRNMGVRRNHLIENENRLTIYCTAEALEDVPDAPVKEDVVFEDFESGSYERWKAKGTAFGKNPVKKGSKGFAEKGIDGDYFVSSYNVRELNGKPNNSSYQWGSITPAHEYTGILTSKPFTVTHDYITFLLGGGYHPEQTAFNLLIDGKVMRTITADNNWQLQQRFFDVRDFLGKKAQLQMVDSHQSMWGSISVDHIVFTDKKPKSNELVDQHGYGSMSWSIQRPSGNAKAALNLEKTKEIDAIIAGLKSPDEHSTTAKPMNEALMGALGDTLKLKPGEEKEVTFILTWYFPHMTQLDVESGELMRLKGFRYLKRHYHNWFRSANQVADYVSNKYDDLAGATRLWNKTYYDSTLPYWLLDRSFISINTLASNTMLWFDNGRIWGWEGVECCQGTCQHVWQYAQGAARIFPLIERTIREVTDLGYSFKKDGGMGHRDETAWGLSVAHDGHCGTIMRMFREHKMSPDNRFLKANYSKIKKTVQFIMSEDKDQDGLLEGQQKNTLDASWYGPMGWISSLYLGALAAGKQMALETGDTDFVDECDKLIEKGNRNIVEKLFNGEYFIHLHDREKYANVISSNDGCHIDQVLGQSFAHQIGIEDRIVPEKETRKALESIWKYNFAPDAFAYQAKHKVIKGVRIYASEGEAGTIMTTWPKSEGDTYAVPGMADRPSDSPLWEGPGGYFDEVWPGQEYQLASHMIYEGMLEKGLATARVVHDRHNPVKRNPYNEIECSDHYSRSMASYGVLLAVSGFDYHGPKGHITFDPKLTPEDFKAPFTVAEGWGTFTQKRTNANQTNSLDLKFGQLNLKTFSLAIPANGNPALAVLTLNGTPLPARTEVSAQKLTWSMDGIILRAGDILKSTIKL